MCDISSLKFFLYDWTGYNQSLSQIIHSSIAYKPFIMWVRSFTQICNFYYSPILFGILLIIFYGLLWRDKKTAMSRGVLYTKCLLLFGLNMFVAAIVFEVIKSFFSYSRPYCVPAFNMKEYLLHLFSYPKKACYSSFPSFHSAYACLLVVSFWKILNKNLKITGIIFIFLIGLSRVILGKHFLADVAYACLIALIIINPLNNLLIAKYFSRYESLVKKFLKKIV